MGVFGGADFLHQLGEPGFRRALFIMAEACPLGVIDMIIQMHHMPAFAGYEWSWFRNHKNNLVPGCDDRCRKKKLERLAAGTLGWAFKYPDRPGLADLGPIGLLFAELGESCRGSE